MKLSRFKDKVFYWTLFGELKWQVMEELSVVILASTSTSEEYIEENMTVQSCGADLFSFLPVYFAWRI